MSEASIDEVVSEEAFAELLQRQSEMFLRLGNTLLGRADEDWTKRHFFQLFSEADVLESFLDDHGARHNRTFHVLRELVASIRSFALAGFALWHLLGRVESYGTNVELYPDDHDDFRASMARAGEVLRRTVRVLVEACRDEVRGLGLALPRSGFPEDGYKPEGSRKKLPRNLGEEVIEEEEQKIAEVVSKFVQVCGMFEEVDVRRIPDANERERFFRKSCSEEQARVYEASVHNLQSAYDTYIKGTAVETKDPRLPRVRGHASAAYHLLEAVTFLVHFVERHEADLRGDEAERRIARLVRREEIRAVTLNDLLYWAWRFLELGRPLAEELLGAYTNVQELEVEMPEDMVLHARPASLIVHIVNRYATPVELDVDGTTCNAGSIIELMITVGSRPNARRFRFRGDENPLRDIGLLFQHGLGERGLDGLPEELGYLRRRS